MQDTLELVYGKSPAGSLPAELPHGGSLAAAVLRDAERLLCELASELVDISAACAEDDPTLLVLVPTHTIYSGLRWLGSDPIFLWADDWLTTQRVSSFALQLLRRLSVLTDPCPCTPRFLHSVQTECCCQGCLTMTKLSSWPPVRTSMP